MKQSFDVVIIGCGAVGASCAHQLSRRGFSVLVLEQSGAPAMGSSGKSAAGVRVQFSTEANVEMSKRSLDVLSNFEARHGIDVGYRPLGYLLLVPASDWTRHLETVAMQQRIGVPVEVLDVAEAERHVRFADHGLGGATFGPIDGVVDPHWLTHAWVRLARSKAAVFRFEEPVRSISRQARHWQISTRTSKVATPLIVNAAGAWSREIAQLAALDLPVEPMRNLIFLSDPVENARQMPMTIDVGSGFFMRPEGEKLLFGRTNQHEPRGFSEGMNWPWLEHVLGAGVERFPWFDQVGVDHRGSWWGYYEMTPDHNPVIGLHPDAKDSSGPVWIDASGFSGHGIMHSPATGELVADLASNTAPFLSIDCFAHDRFSQTLAGAPESNAF